MSIACPTALRSFLTSIDAKPLKALSQNFLIDANIVRKIADSVSIEPGEWVLEIGPGPGALTAELLKRGAKVIAIEKDRKFAKALERLQTEDQRLTIYEADVLDFDFSLLPSPLKAAANLPYHITTPILEKLCEHPGRFSSAHLMVQKEVADRMLAKPGSKEISSLTLFLQLFAKVSIAVKVSESCFYPAPKVASSVIKLDFHTPPLKDPKPLTDWIRKAYQQRRKMLRSTLGIVGEMSTLRPESLSLDDWIALYRSQQMRLFFEQGSPFLLESEEEG